jgi:hypothetical protein
MWTGGTAAKTRSVVRPLAILGALLVIAGAPLPWNKFTFDSMGLKLGAKFLVTGKASDLLHVNIDNPANPKVQFSIISIGLLVFLIGVVALLLSFIRPAHVLRRILGVLAIAIGVLFVVQLVIGPLDISIGDVFKDLGPGAYTTVVGGILVLAG